MATILKESAQRYYQKSAEVCAIKFRTNNETGDINMNSVCIAANQGRSPDSDYHCWHNGTEIFVENPRETWRAQVGDWIVSYPDGKINVFSDADFHKHFGDIDLASFEAEAAR